MCADIAIKIDHLSKCYQIYDNPRDRLLQMLMRGHKQYYKEFWALKDVSFEVKKGETVGIIGCNGSGKSTLLQLICGTLNPTAGNIQSDGRIAALLELGSGFNPEFTGRENVYMNASVMGLRSDEIDQRFQAIADFADIGEFIEQPVKTYSSGMMVRLAFAVAINVDPEILIVDEALSVGDELFQRKCFSRIEAIRAAGSTILFVSHSAGTITELCDRAILFDAGEKIAIGKPKEIVGLYQKLIYAPADKRANIRKQICGTAETAEISSQHADEGIAEIKIKKHNVLNPERFDENLTPKSTIIYESNGAVIGSPVLRNEEGEQVNNILRGKTYSYLYNVRFDKSARNVRFGMLIKTMSGVELGGGVSASSPGYALDEVKAGSVYQVTFSFRCCLNPGVYFLNAGVVGELDGSEVYLHRLLDIAMFRVLQVENNLSTGIVDFDCTSEIVNLD